MVKTPKSSLITPILRSLHWLKINERIEYKLLSLTYKVLTPSQPDYLQLHITSSQSRPLLSPSSSRPYTLVLKLISFTKSFLHSHSYSFRTAFADLNLYWIKGELTFICFSFFFLYIFFWLHVLDKTEYSAFESTLNSSIVSYHISRVMDLWVWKFSVIPTVGCNCLAHTFLHVSKIWVLDTPSLF